MRAVRSIAGLMIVVLFGSAAFAPRSAPGPRTLTVRPADTLTAIALRAGVTVSALAAENAIRDPNRIFAGQVLRLPPPPPAWHPPAVRGFANGGRGLPLLLLAHRERVMLRPFFIRWATAYGVPPDLLQALAWWESGWQNGVVSQTGAVGIGQLMPATVVFVNVVLLRGANLDLKKPEDNIRMSARFLRALLDATGGRADLAVASYYQGLASVRQGRILAETKHYVAGILAYRSHFA